MEDLVFVPRKSVPVWRLKGYAPVSGSLSPPSWAVLMQKVEKPAVEAPEPASKPYQRFTANRSRAISIVTSRRFAREAVTP